MNQPARSAPETPPAPDLEATAMFLDFDGTLAPIAPRPDLARIGDETRATLARLEAALAGALAIVSGRSLADLDALLAPLVLPAAGSHGLERRTASGAIEAADGGPALQAEIDRIAAFGARHGLLVERKRAGVAVHYRERPELEAECLAEVDAAVARLPG
ncbi:MAG: trehalose-phosphatase, partial [Alphaproteobacteria bacterium]